MIQYFSKDYFFTCFPKLYFQEIPPTLVLVSGNALYISIGQVKVNISSTDIFDGGGKGDVQYHPSINTDLIYLDNPLDFITAKVSGLSLRAQIQSVECSYGLNQAKVKVLHNIAKDDEDFIMLLSFLVNSPEFNSTLPQKENPVEVKEIPQGMSDEDILQLFTQILIEEEEGSNK